jgi:hypothetical protein
MAPCPLRVLDLTRASAKTLTRRGRDPCTALPESVRVSERYRVCAARVLDGRRRRRDQLGCLGRGGLKAGAEGGGNFVNQAVRAAPADYLPSQALGFARERSSVNNPGPAEERSPEDSRRHEQSEQDQLNAEQQQRDHDDRHDDDEKRKDGHAKVIETTEIGYGEDCVRSVPRTYLPDARFAPPGHSAVAPTAPDPPFLPRRCSYRARSNAYPHLAGDSSG